MVGVGGMIGAGVFVLTGKAIALAGPAALLAFFLNGLLSLCTTMSFAEMAGRIPEAGGGFSYFRHAFPRQLAFSGGWVQWFAYTVSSAVFALGFAIFFWEFLRDYIPAANAALLPLLQWWPGSHVALIAALVVAAFTAINCQGVVLTGRTQNLLSVGKVVILAVFCGCGLWYAITHAAQLAQAFGVGAAGAAQPGLPLGSALAGFMPHGFGGVALAMGFTFIAFKGYDLIATLSEEVRRPERTIPRAMFISVIVGWALYLLIVFAALAAYPPAAGVPGWQRLGDLGERAILGAAAVIVPRGGIALIMLGGAFAFTSALNAMVLAGSRTAFAMARDNMLPRLLTGVHPRRLTPVPAVLLTGGIAILLLASFDLTVVGSAASVMYLLRFALANVAAIVLHRQGFVSSGGGGPPPHTAPQPGGRGPPPPPPIPV